MNILNYLLDSWIPHFSFSIITLLVSYFTLFLALASQDLGRCSYWDELFDKFRAFLTTQKIQISKDIKIVLIKGDQDHKCYLCLSEFAKYYDLLISTRKKVQKLNNDRNYFMCLSVIFSIVYATVLLVIGEGGIKVSETASYFVPSAFIAVVSLFFLPIYDARHKITSFVAEKSKKESEMKAKHGTFYDIEEIYVK